MADHTVVWVVDPDDALDPPAAFADERDALDYAAEAGGLVYDCPVIDRELAARMIREAKADE